MVGVALTIVAHAELWSHRITPRPLQLTTSLVLIVTVLLLLYFAGMVLNDAFDAKRDKVTRPDRAIPMGVISVKQAWATGFFMLSISILLAFGISVSAGIASSVLALTVMLYTFFHHTPLVAIALMAICRGMVFIVVVSAFSKEYYSQMLWMYSGALAFYTGVLTFVGTFENQNLKIVSFAIFLTLIPVGFVVFISEVPSALLFGFALAFVIWMYLAWRNFQLPENGEVHGMHKLLSGFALLDCVFIAALGEYHIMVLSIICFALTVAAHRKILGT